MVTYCTVCMNNTRTKKDISYFNYPKDSIRRNKWLKAVGREDLVPKIIDDNTRQRYRICQDHFERSKIFHSKNKTKKYLHDHAFPTLNLPSNNGASSSQCETIISAQENQDIQIIPKTEPCSSLNIFSNKIVVLQDQTSSSTETDPNEQTYESKTAQTALHLSADTPRKRKLTLELREEKKHNTCDLDSVTNEDFLKLCDKFMTQDKKLQGKWRNLRDSYVRFVRGRTGKNYTYAAHLSFLKERYKDNESGAEPETYLSDNDSRHKVEEIELGWSDDESRSVKRRKKDSVVEYVETNTDPFYSTEDEDKSFFDSLLPAVRDFDMDQKLEFRSEVIKLIKNIRKLGVVTKTEPDSPDHDSM